MSSQVNMVDSATVKDWIAANNVVVVDVREANEYAVEHIPGSHLVPLSSFDTSKLPPVPEGKKLLLHCRSANRCGMAAGKMLQQGYKGEINRLAGGMIAWVASGGQVKSGPES